MSNNIKDILNTNFPEVYELLKLADSEIVSNLNCNAAHSLVTKQVQILAASYSAVHRRSEGFSQTNLDGEADPTGPENPYVASELMDELQNIMRSSLLKAFPGFSAVSVGAQTGSIANIATFDAVVPASLYPQDQKTVLAWNYSDGAGHVTHGAAGHKNSFGRNIIFGKIEQNTGYIDIDSMRDILMNSDVDLVVYGGSVCFDIPDSKKIHDVIREVDKAKSRENPTIIMYDASHTAFMHIKGINKTLNLPDESRKENLENISKYVDLMMIATDKVIRGAKGGVILCKNPKIRNKINEAIFPNLTGGTDTSKFIINAAQLSQILTDKFTSYIQSVVKLPRAMQKKFSEKGLDTFGKTVTHMTAINLEFGEHNTLNSREVTQELYQELGISVTAMQYMGKQALRIGSPMLAARGVSIESAEEIAAIIADQVLSIKKFVEDTENYPSFYRQNSEKQNNNYLKYKEVTSNNRQKVLKITDKYPLENSLMQHLIEKKMEPEKVIAENLGVTETSKKDIKGVNT